MAWSISSGQAARAQPDPASLEELVTLIRIADQGLRNIEYKVNFVNGELAPGDGVWELQNQSASRFRAFLRKDVGSERFLADYSAVIPFQESPAKGGSPTGHAQTIGSASFDGVSYCEWQRAAADDRGDKQDCRGEGLIDKSDTLLGSSAFRRAYGNVAGLLWMPPAFFVHPDTSMVAESLSSFLMEAAKKGLPIAIERSGEVSIVRVVGVQLPDEFPVTVEIHWHREMAGIVEQRWYYDINGKQETLQHGRMRLRKIEGRGFPEEAALVEFGRETNDMARWQFTDYRVNQALEPSDFRLQFPDDIIPHRRPDDLRAGDEPSDGAESRQRPAE